MGNIENQSVNAIRVLAADAVQKAKSGHPGLPLGCAGRCHMNVVGKTYEA